MARPWVARAWVVTSALLAIVGSTTIVSALGDTSADAPERLDVPVAVAPPAAASTTTPPSTTAPTSTVAPSSSTAPPPTTAPQSTTAASPPAAAPSMAAPVALPPSEPVRVEIPALGMTSDIMRLGLDEDGTMEVPPGAYPVGWYDRSPTPGELGPAVLAGHVDWGDERGAFYGLRVLRQGDQIVVHRADGTAATFAVGRVERHPKDEFPTGEVYGSVDWAALRLITCGGSFDEDSGDYRDNVIAFARLVAVN